MSDGVTFRVGVGQVDDVGFTFAFDDDPEAPPTIAPSSRCSTAGAEWMLRHAPRQWAAFCAARLLGTHEVRIVGEENALP